TISKRDWSSDVCSSDLLSTSQVSTCLAGCLLSCFELSLSVLQCLLGVSKLGCVIVSLGTVRGLSKVNLIELVLSLVDGIKIWLERCLLLVVLVNSSLVSRSPGTIWISIVACLVIFVILFRDHVAEVEVIVLMIVDELFVFIFGV